ncbi:MAG: hypothetical protein JXB85_12740 [Anaerolineales bacterium]|nr:hypothetical protein [Anaerolineales bacterium]
MKKSEFERMVDNAFINLTRTYKFTKTETKFEQRSCTVRYQNATTEITLNYELGGRPWLAIGEVNQPENRSTLGWLLVELGVDPMPTLEQAFHPVTMEDAELEQAMIKMNDQLLEHGVALLKGDFEILPALQARARKYALACKRLMASRQKQT